jgi:hypothetical protein
MSQTSIGTTSRHWPARMRTREASEYLFEKHGIRLSPNTLNKLRVVGGSPPYQKDGRYPVFTPDGLDGFALKRLGPVRHSTTDDARIRAASGPSGGTL